MLPVINEYPPFLKLHNNTTSPTYEKNNAMIKMISGKLFSFKENEYKPHSINCEANTILLTALLLKFPLVLENRYIISNGM